MLEGILAFFKTVGAGIAAGFKAFISLIANGNVLSKILLIGGTVVVPIALSAIETAKLMKKNKDPEPSNLAEQALSNKSDIAENNIELKTTYDDTVKEIGKNISKRNKFKPVSKKRSAKDVIREAQDLCDSDKDFFEEEYDALSELQKANALREMKRISKKVKNRAKKKRNSYTERELNARLDAILNS